MYYKEVELYLVAEQKRIEKKLYDYCKKIKTGKIVNDTIIYKTKYNKHPREGITNIRLRCVETSCKLSIEGKIYPFELDKPLYW